MLNIFDTTSIIKATGYAGIFGVIFSETGLLIGFFLPGDSLLFTAGFLASTGYLNIGILLVIAFVAAVIGDSTGYALGKKYGRGYFNREESALFKKSYLLKAEALYEEHGGKAIILGRFMPVVRTLVPVLAGVARMRYVAFITYNLIGGALWAIGLSLFGYYFGKVIPNADRYVLPIIAAVVVISILPSIIVFIREYRK